MILHDDDYDDDDDDDDDFILLQLHIVLYVQWYMIT